MAAAKQILRSLLPPFLWKFRKRVAGSSGDRFECVPATSAASMPADDGYWPAFIARERSACVSLMERVRAGDPFMDRDEGLKHLTYAYVIALAARRQQPLRVLDYGGNLGDYYWIARAFVPGIELDYHCKELPAVAAAGRELNPDISWHVDDQCLAQQYDVVMFSSSLQYVADWRAILRRAARASRGSLFLSDVPTVRTLPTFFVRQHTGKVSNLQQHLNRTEIISLVESEGMRVVREFEMGSHPEVERAPEQPVSMGWLFECR